MTPRDQRQPPQRDLLDLYLDEIIDMRHELVQMGQRIDWVGCDNAFEPSYASDNGRPGLPVRLQVGLQLLKHLYDLSDREVLARWVENPYWQVLCGESIFQHRLPMDETTMLRFRQRIGEEGARQLLKMTIRLGEETGAVSPESFRTLVVDTTVMPKAIAYPTDARLVSRCHLQLVTLAKAEGVKFKRTFCRNLESMARKVGRYAHARQFKRMHRVLKKMHHNLVDICAAVIDRRPRESRSEALDHKLFQALQLLDQYDNDKVQSRLYSLHEPEVVCLTKGKARQRYEFGAKVSVVTTAEETFVLDSQALNGNPYDGHTLDTAIIRTWLNTGHRPHDALVDRGYKGSQECRYCDVRITGRQRGKGKAHDNQHRRKSIEPIIGHMKSDGLLSRCYLKGHVGDMIHALLCGVGMNLRKIMKKLRALLFARIFYGIVRSFSVECRGMIIRILSQSSQARSVRSGLSAESGV